MAYITQSNMKKIIFNSEIKNLDCEGEIYKMRIHFFSKYEKNELLAIQELLKDPENYFNTIYKPYVPVDTYTLVYEGRHPSYHQTANCQRLTAKYENFEIPEDIIKMGKEKILEFREWFKTVEHLLETPDIFVARLYSRWQINTNPRAITIDNSGSVEIEDITIEELEQKIDTTIKDAGYFCIKDEKSRRIFCEFSQHTFLAYGNKSIYKNNTGYSDNEVKELLWEFDNKFKKQLKNMLIEYYRLKFNPDIKMEGKVLEMLGFRACRHCYNVTADF